MRKPVLIMETAAILVSMRGNCGDDQENDSIDDLLGLNDRTITNSCINNIYTIFPGL